MNLRPLWLAVALALPVVAVAHSADAAPRAAAASLRAARVTSIDGRFERYVVSPRGHVMGFVLHDGTYVEVNQRAFLNGKATLRRGDAVHVEGHARRNKLGAFVGHAVVSRGGQVVANGRLARRVLASVHLRRAAHRHAIRRMKARGRIVALLHGKGRNNRVRALVLSDGTMAFVGRRESFRAYHLKVGDRVRMRGQGASYALGRSMRVHSIRLPNGKARVIGRAI